LEGAHKYVSLYRGTGEVWRVRAMVMCVDELGAEWGCTL